MQWHLAAMSSFIAAEAADLPTVLDLLSTLDSDGRPPMDLQRAEEVFSRMLDYPDYTVWLYRDAQGATIGTYSLLIMDNLGHRGAPAAIVENVAVVAHARGQGAGTAMMQHAMAHARARGCYKLVLSSNIARERAHAFYDRLGFTRHGISFMVELDAQVAGQGCSG
jgi:GNAT superfamily N-acetyltransferase